MGQLPLPPGTGPDDAVVVPGQRKRKRQQQDTSRRVTARTASGTGHWTVLFETQDASEWHAQLRRPRSAEEQIDRSMTRVDTLCGRLVQPTTYRLSLFVPGPEPASQRDVSGH